MATPIDCYYQSNFSLLRTTLEAIMQSPIPVIDLFAGPGGLCEGFSSLRNDHGERIFQTVMSIEMETYAHTTLRMRSFYRKIFDRHHHIPHEYIDYLADSSEQNLQRLKDAFPSEWEAANYEAVQGEMKEDDPSLINEAKRRIATFSGPKIIIGGPPCQAYSLVGRSRRAHDPKFPKDPKQTLYKCYLQFIHEINPDIFVMENVKGMLSARLHSQYIFDMIRKDINDEGYEIHSLVVNEPQKPADYTVHAEQYGIPQARHRVILLGVRNDIHIHLAQLKPQHETTVAEALAGIPSIRSSFSRRTKDVSITNDWTRFISRSAHHIAQAIPDVTIKNELAGLTSADLPTETSSNHIDKAASDNRLTPWYRSDLIDAHSHLLTNHMSRSHMASDLQRYLFAAAYAAANGKSPQLKDFPKELLPGHHNVAEATDLGNVGFADRFRVQLYDHPATTVTAHIAKDGHYFIHPDYRQCRSLSVREAARLQTFPDDYWFAGNRTSQYQQIGNAVPPLLANQIAAIIAHAYGIHAANYFESTITE